MNDDDLAGIIDGDSEVIDEQPDYGHGADIPASATGSWGGDIDPGDLDVDPVIGPDHGAPRRLVAHGHPATVADGGLSPAIAAAWAMWGDY